MTKNEREASMHSIGECADCGKRNTFTSKRAAKKYARKKVGRSEHLNAYECPHRPGFFHFGVLPKMVTNGDATRADLRPKYAAA